MDFEKGKQSGIDYKLRKNKRSCLIRKIINKIIIAEIALNGRKWHHREKERDYLLSLSHLNSAVGITSGGFSR